MATNYFEPVQPKDKSPFTEVGEAALAIPRGIEAAVQDTYNFFDYATFGVLPDYDERFLGESEDAGDRLIEGIANFATVFVPVSGALGALGKATKVGKALGFGAKSGFGFWAKTATAGALTDLLAYGGHEQRLSDLIESNPALSNPISEFLASDEDDSEAEGRLKNVLEGFVLGTAVDLAVAGFRGLKVLKKLPPEATPEDAAKALADAGVSEEALAAAENLGKGTQLDLPFEEPVGLGFKPKREVVEVAEPTDLAPTPYDKGLQGLGFTVKDAHDLVGRINARKGKGLSVNPRDLSEEELRDLLLDKNHINLSHIQTEDDVVNLMRAAEDLIDQVGGDDLRAVQSFADQDREAASHLQDMLGLTDASEGLTAILKVGEDLEKDAARVTGRIKAWGFLSVEAARSLNETLKPFIESGGTDALRGAEAAIQVENYVRMMATMARTRSVIGRTLGYFRREIPGSIVDPEFAKQIVDGRGGLDALHKMALQIQAAFGSGDWRGVAAVTHLTKTTKLQRLGNASLEYWMNAILSGPKTATVNALSGALMTVYRPMELMLGAKVGKFLGATDGREFQEATQELAGLVHSFKESWQIAKQAGKEGRGILSSRTVIDTQEKAAISAAGLGLEDTSIAGRAADFIGNIVRFPSKILQGTDEFVKQINYRSVARRQFLQEAAAKGYSPLEAAEYATRQMNKLIFEGQAFSDESLFRRGLRDAEAKGVVNPAAKHAHAAKFSHEFYQAENGSALKALSEQALGVAEEVTFQKPLASGTLGARYQAAVAAHPTLRLVTPFVRTPLNIAYTAGQKMDYLSVARVIHAKKFGKGLESLAGSKSRLIQDVLSGSSRKKAEAIGRLSAGAGFFFVGITAAQQGLITGRGPRDPEMRQILSDTGWLPYSFKVGDKYVQYGRVEPFSIMFGLIADISDYAKHGDVDDQGALETAMTGLMVGLANNFANKTYLTGIRNFVDALNDPERQMEKFIQRYAASLVPNIAGQAVGAAGDQSMRELRSYADAMLDKLPGFSQNLPPRRNILGEPVRRIRAAGSEAAGIIDWFNPIAWSSVSDDLVYKELKDLGHGFTPPRRVRGGVDLAEFKNSKGQDAYDRWGELQGEISLGGMNLRSALRKLIKSSSYQRLPAEGTLEVESPRVALIKKVVNRYQNASFRQLLREYPDVRAESERILQTKSALRRGVSPALL